MDQIGNVDLSGWNVQPVTSMFKTFYGASSFNGNLTVGTQAIFRISINVSRRDFVFGIGLSTWNTARKNMDSTFRDSSSLTEDIGSWNVERWLPSHNVLQCRQLSFWHDRELECKECKHDDVGISGASHSMAIYHLECDLEFDKHATQFQRCCLVRR